MMKKSLIALAIAAAAPAAFAATSNVEISGKIAMDVQSVSGIADKDASSDGKGFHANNNNSVITVAGNEDLGGGMKAFFSLSYGLPMTSAGALSGQNQIVGLEGGFGKVFAGAFDNPTKVIGRGVDLFGDQSAGDARYLTSVGVSDARANDVVAYISPSMSGAQLVLAHANQNTGGAADAGRINIVKLTYANGPLSVAVSHDKTDNAASSDGADAKTLRATGSYKMGDTRLVALYQTADNTSGAASTDSKTWGVGAAHAMGPITLKAQYYAYDLKNSANDAKMTAVGMDYSLSKRTTLQVAYSKVSNDGTATLGGSAAVAGSDALTIAAGEDPARFSIGMKHTF